MEYEPTLHTTVLIATFCVLYFLLLIHRTLRGQLDLYDLLMLSTIAIVPGIFVFMPALGALIGRIAGVTFPFIVMFGILLMVIFVFLHRMTLRLRALERKNRLLVQELALLREEIRD